MRCRFVALLALLGALTPLFTLVSTPVRADEKVLRVALNQDPDILDPTLTQAYVTSIVLINMCERLYDLSAEGQLVPMLAAALPKISEDGKTVEVRIRPGLRFNDGTPANAQAVKFSLERHKTLKGSTLRNELEMVTGIEVVDPVTVRLTLSHPFPPLTASFAARAGSLVSPAQVAALGDKFNSSPVCVGPWKFDKRVPQDRIELVKSPYYYDPQAAQFDRVIFRIMPDDAVRLANLRSGDIDMEHLVPPTDSKVLKAEGAFTVSEVWSLGYQGITINLANKSGMKNPAVPLTTPLASNPKVREALDYSIDRTALNQVAFEGMFTPDCTPISPQSPFYPKGIACPKRDIPKAKRLLTEAGYPHGVTIELMVLNDPLGTRVGQILQSMVAEAGITLTVKPMEFASSLAETFDGRYEAYLIGWSGRPDPDGNMYLLETCNGSVNRQRACDASIDAVLTQAREAPVFKQRLELYRKAIELLNQRRDIIVLYHLSYIVAYKKGLTGYSAVPDGVIRLKGLRLG